MSSKRVGGGMMIGLALLAGCSHSPKTPDIEALFPTREDAGRTAPDRPPASPVTAAHSLTKGSSEAEGPVTTKRLPPYPEVVGVHVVGAHPGEAPPHALIPGRELPDPPAPARVDEVIRTSCEATSCEATPAVLFIEAEGPQAQGASDDGWVAPTPAKKTPEVLHAAVTAVGPAAGPAPAAGPVPEYGHAADYSWLTGELQYLSARNVWRLRYAPPDQEDRYGGTVLLVGDGMPGERTRGQIVRVEGQIVNPEPGASRASFWVRTCRTLKAAPATQE